MNIQNKNHADMEPLEQGLNEDFTVWWFAFLEYLYRTSQGSWLRYPGWDCV